MLTLHFICPECNKDFTLNGYWKWILTAPFHWFIKRKTKCPHCQKRSYVSWHAITKEKR